MVIIESSSNTFTVYRAKIDFVVIIESSSNTFTVYRAKIDFVVIIESSSNTFTVYRAKIDFVVIIESSSNTFTVYRAKIDFVVIIESPSNTCTVYRAKIEFVVIIESSSNTFTVYRAKINQKEKKAILRQLKPKGERFELDFKTDTYTPTSKLPKRGFILVTHKDLSKDDDFIATSKDKLFTVGNMCKFRRTLRRMCKRLRKRKNQLA